jgi:hypothetical protein
MALHHTLHAGRSLTRLVTAILPGTDAARGAPERVVVTIPDRDPEVSLEALRELQALNQSWADASEPPRDIRWID